MGPGAARCKGLSMLALDHFALLAPTLAEGVAYVEAALGLPMAGGGQHPAMGTHNRLLRLGEVYLEVIAVDPAAPAPAHRRWFGLDDAAFVRAEWKAGRRLRAFAARTDDLAGWLAQRPSLGRALRASRGARTWRIAVPEDGSLPEGGLAPTLLQWDPPGPPVGAMPDSGARLVSFTLETPEVERAREVLEELRVTPGPEVRRGAMTTLRAMVETKAGLKKIE